MPTKDWDNLKGEYIKFKVGYDHETAEADSSANNIHITDDNRIVLNGVTFSADLKTRYAYGIEWDVTQKTADVVRIGDNYLHRTLPVQSQMRGCLLDDNGNVVEYLPDDDWTNSTRDGSKGQVMVELPEYWVLYETEGNIKRVWLSAVEIPGFKHVKKMYVSAYQAVLDRTNNKLCSIINEDPQYRGGSNISALDGGYYSQLGHPVSGYGMTRIKFRECARKRNDSKTSEWNLYLYECHKTIFWFFVVEYATRNSQLAYTSELTSEGFHKGGLGGGVTQTWYLTWLGWLSYNSLCKCGYTDSFGNNTGCLERIMNYEYDSVPTDRVDYTYSSTRTYPKDFYLIARWHDYKLYRSKQETTGHTITETDYWEQVDLYQGEYDSTVTYTKDQFVSSNDNLYMCLQECTGQSVTDTTYFKKQNRTILQPNRYRGVENPFGNFFLFTDGVNIRVSANVSNGGDGRSKVYTCYDPSKFSDTAYTDYKYIGDLLRESKMIQDVIFGDDGDVIASTGGGSATTGFCDYNYAGIPSSGESLRALLVGGYAYDGSADGLACVYSYLEPSGSDLHVGSRLCFRPE